MSLTTLLRRRRNLVIAAALVAIAGILAWRSGSSSRPGANLRYVTAQVDRGPLAARVTATGTLSALVTVQVGSQVSGRLQQINVDFNSEVKKGDVIARIDPQLFEASLQQARANLVAAQGNLARAKAQAQDARRQARRADELHVQKLVSEGERDTARSNAEGADAGVAAAQGGVAQAQAALKQAEINLAYTQILAPTDGVVISRSVDVGQTVAATLQAPTLFTIAEDLRKMQVDTNVAEADVGRLTSGMNATFTVDAYPGERFEGAVRQIRNAPTTLQNVVTYDAVIDVANAELKLKPGMTANVVFVYADRKDVLRVPNGALRFRPPDALASRDGDAASQQRSGGRQGNAGPKTVWVLRDEVPQPVAVQTGVSDGALTEVTGGELREGDVVIIDARDESKKQAPMRMM